MGRAEMLARMDSQELTGFLALMKVHDDERAEAEERAKLIADSDDGEVIEFNKPSEEDEDDEADDSDG